MQHGQSNEVDFSAAYTAAHLQRLCEHLAPELLSCLRGGTFLTRAVPRTTTLLSRLRGGSLEALNAAALASLLSRLRGGSLKLFRE